MSQRLNAVFAAISILASGLLALAAQAQQAAPNPRIALVIGNATYRDAALATTANDAGLVAQTLQAAGFDVVGARDLDGQSLRTAFRDFLQKAEAAGPDMQAFVYLAGRAVQYNGDNYFVPVDAQINRDADVPIEAIRIGDFAHALAVTPGRARIIVLDAARANPYAAQGAPLAPGLALVDPEPGELIAFNAAPGTLAGDEEGPYGVYGKTLAGAIRQGGVDIAQAFDQTRVSVNAETQGALLPWSASKLGGPFYVFERAADAPPPALSFAQTERRPISSFSAEDAYSAAVERDTMKGYREFLAAYPHSDQARRVRAILAVRREAAYWRRTVSADTPRAYWTYLHVYPRGPHVPDARRRLAMLSAGFEPPPDFRPEAFADLPPPPPDELAYDDQPIYAFDDFGPPPPPPPVQYGYLEDDDWRDLPPPPPPAEIGVLPVLGFAIPIAIGAVAFHNGFHRDGVAPRGQPRLREAPARAAAAARQHQTRGAARAGCGGRRSCGQRGCRQASPADWRSPRPTRRAAALGGRPGQTCRRAASQRCEACRSHRSGRQAFADPSGRRCRAQRASGAGRQAVARGPLAKRSGSGRGAGRNETRGESAASSRRRRDHTRRQAIAGAEAQCRGSAAGRGAPRAGSAACASRSRASGGPGARASAIRASSGSCGNARPCGASRAGSPRAPGASRAGRPCPTASSRSAACASSAPACGASPAAGQAAASVREARAAALSEVAFAGPFYRRCRRGGLCKIIARRAKGERWERAPDLPLAFIC